MANRMNAGLGLGIAALAATAWLACASEASPELSVASNELPRIPEAQRAVNPAPGEALSVTALSGGGVLVPGALIASETGSVGHAEVVEAAAELPPELVATLSGGALPSGSLELSRTADTSGIGRISLNPGTSMLGDEFDFPTPSLNAPSTPAAPAYE